MKMIRGILLIITTMSLSSCGFNMKDPMAYLPATAISLIQQDAQNKNIDEQAKPAIGEDSALMMAMKRLSSSDPSKGEEDTQSINTPQFTEVSVSTNITDILSLGQENLTLPQSASQIYAAKHIKPAFVTKTPKPQYSYDFSGNAPKESHDIASVMRSYNKRDIAAEDKEYFVLLINTDQRTQNEAIEKVTEYLVKGWIIEKINYAPLEYNDDALFTNTALASLSKAMAYTAPLRGIDQKIQYKFDSGLELKSIAIHLVKEYETQGGQPNA